MPNIIVNTSPIQYLYQAHLLDLLLNLYGQIIVPESVADELAVGLSLGISLPDIYSISWIEIRSAQSKAILPLVTELGAGERETLALALEIPESLLILDDGLARRYAQLLKLEYIGTLGILLKAKKKGYLERVKPILDRLDTLKFRLALSTRNKILKLAGEEQE